MAVRISKFLLLVTVVLFGTALYGQVSTTTVVGTVTTVANDAVPGATVVLTQTDTNFTRTVTTKEDGVFRAEFLPVGPYSMKVTATGFKEFKREGITLRILDTATLDAQLAVGEVTEVVTVTGDLPQVNTTNATLGRTIDNREVDNLPLVGRDVYQLLTLTPGVQLTTNVNNTGFPEQHTLINGSTDGTVGQISYYLDGGTNMTGLRNTGNILPNPDAIREFTVQTSNFSAQYGRSSAGFVSVITKSGTNQVHGSIFEFVRNTSLIATTHNGIPKSQTPYHRNQFGATLGGPILHDKLFFFGSYGGLRQSTTSTLSALVPTAAQRAGDFSANLPTSGSQSTCRVVNANQFVLCRPDRSGAYAGNIVPVASFDPVAKTILDRYVPLPNPVGRSTDTVNTRTDPLKLAYVTDEFLIKGDYQPVASHRITASYFQSNGNSQQNPGSTIAGWSMQNFNWRQQNANISDTWILSASTVNQLWLGYTRQIGGRVNTPAISLGDLGSTFQIQGAKQLPQIAVANWFTLGQSISGPLAGANVYQLRDVVSTTKGKHTLAAGGEISLEKDMLQTLLNNYGVFAFTSTASARTGISLSDFLLGRPNTMNQDSTVYANANYWNYGFFAQDDWRLIPRLTLNLGLRYDVQTAPTDSLRRQSNFRAGVQSVVVPSAPTGLLFPGDPGVPETGAPTPYNHVSPRFGFAFDAFGNGKTVVRGAAGLFFGTIGGNEWQYPSNNQPYAIRQQYNKVVSLANPYATDTAEFPGGVSPYPYTFDPKAPRFTKPAGLVTMDPNYKWPYNYQINFGVQQQISRSTALTLSYVASLSRKLPLFFDHNYPVYNSAAPSSNTTSNVDNRRPLQPGGSATDPTLKSVYVVESGQTSNYNGLQVTLDQRMTKNISLRSFYTWSKTMWSAYMANNTLQNPLEDFNFPQLERQRADSDIRNVSVTSIVWKTDYFGRYNRAVRGALNGWTMSAIVTLQSGAPFNVTTGSDTNADGNNNDRPNVLPGKVARVVDNGSSRVAMMNQWFDTSAFCVFSPGATNGASTCRGAGDAGQTGTFRYNSLDGPGVRNVDASLFRDVGIVERVKLQLRAEVTNVFNLTNLGQPTGAVSNANFGKILGSNSYFPNRRIQLGARLLF
ncbi:TonB-dependent receptor [Terriglobus tenax]|uniref:TonB-dependent receptor n=1 Tax=Terriglobus tenax TaxID=1111115 RepID=UPI0021DF545D|nr:carboxypeptidase regulatory-like domain-containing protein [Terriglobus tenax]